MYFPRVTQLAVIITTCVAAPLTPASATEAQNVEKHPIQTLGESVQVRGYPIGEGERSTFRNRREEVVKATIKYVEAAYGKPVLTEVVRPTHVLLSYPDKLVAVTGEYSNGIVCRIEIETSALRLGFTVDQTIRLAARSCRKAEEDGWGDVGVTPLIPVGTSAVPPLNDVRASVYATDMHSEVFRSLMREAEIRTGSRASLVRNSAILGEPFPPEGEVVWRYAWFENGDLLFVRYQQPTYSRGRRQKGLACSVVLKSSEADNTSLEAFSNWCDSQSGRLLPELEAFFDAVREYRLTIDRDSEPGVIATYSGFHLGEFPKELTARYWETGEVEAN